MSTKPRNQDADGDNCLSKYEYVFKEDLLKGQVAFVTGGGSGIGFRIAEILMRHGCNLAIASRKLERVETAAKKLERATGGRCIALKADIRNPKEIENAVDEILRHYGKINILVNNAAGNFLCDAESLSYNAFKTVLEIDTMGTFNVSKAVFQKYFKDHGGSIVNITATLHYKGDVMQVHAGSAKAAIDAMTKHLAVEWGGNGVRINCIAPGPINGTEGFKRLGGNSSVADAFVESIPVQRWGRKYEIADTVVYLASNASSYVTGAVLIVDGGTWLTSFNNFSLVKNMVSSSKL